MSRRNIYCIIFAIVTVIVQSCTPLLQSKPPTDLIFRQCIIMRIYVYFSPKKNKGNREKLKIRKKS